MTSDTLSYNEDEVTAILSQVTEPSDFLQTPASEFKTRDLERETRRLLNYELHSITLAEYLKTKRIPRGLRIRTRPTFFKDNPEFCIKFEQILNKCSFDIITLTLSFLHTAIMDTKELIQATENQLKEIVSPDEYTQLQQRISTILTDRRKTIEATKRQKFLRDTEDYRLNRVYRWPDSSYRQATDKRSSSMDSYRSASSDDSHAQRRPTRGPRRGNRTGPPPMPSNVTTRSQAH
ncbi:uncharacterized protein LOC120977901 [Bufo bufo]|uniref:uncharacterized protein LOC120977901 n=1 Tax=Bufo bufo TaxID=8384 RepID=UPI001ABECEE5|nr:uncharacterized protein LOC120977901 [Bufo bufo]